MALTRRDEDTQAPEDARGRLRRFASHYAKYLITAGVIGVGLIIFVLVWFQPQKIFLEETANEARPEAPAASPTGVATSAPAAGTIAAGNFRSLEHETTGRAEIVRLADGSHILRFENLDTSNGPDLFVYLSELPSNLGWRDYGERFIDLGRLKANRGNANYKIPAGVDISRYKSAVIWCRRFTVGFGVAPLNAA
jgi:hypothetical protein